MHQEAFPGEDISDRPEPETAVPALRASSTGTTRAAATARPTSARRWRHDRAARDVLPAARRGARRRPARAPRAGPGRGAAARGPPGVIEHRRFHELADVLAPRRPARRQHLRDPARRRRRRPPRASDGACTSRPQLDDGDWVVERGCPDGPGPAGRGRRAAARCPASSLRLSSRYPAAPSGGCGGRGRCRRSTASATSRARPPDPLRAPRPATGRSAPTRTCTPPAGQRRDAERRAAADRALLVRLMARGVTVAPLVLHTGVSSQEKHEPPQAERFRVPGVTARLVNGARAAGAGSSRSGPPSCGRSSARRRPGGSSRRPAGPTSSSARTGRRGSSTGLVTGLHEPEASHLDLLEAVAGTALVDGHADVTAAVAGVPVARVRRHHAAAALTPTGGGRSAGQEGEPHLALGVVDVEVDEADALPGAEREPAAEHRAPWRTAARAPASRGSGRARAAVAVPPAVVGRQQVAERGEQVVVAARTGLDDRDAGGRMRDEHVQQPVAAPGDEAGAVAGQVEDGLAGAGAVGGSRCPSSGLLPASSRRRDSTRSTLAVSWPSYPGRMSALRTSPTRWRDRRDDLDGLLDDRHHLVPLPLDVGEYRVGLMRQGRTPSRRGWRRRPRRTRAGLAGGGRGDGEGDAHAKR